MILRQIHFSPHQPVNPEFQSFWPVITEEHVFWLTDLIEGQHPDTKYHSALNTDLSIRLKDI